MAFHHGKSTHALWTALAALGLLFGGLEARGEGKSLRWDGGAPGSPVMEGFERLTGADAYTPERGHGWETPSARGVEFEKVIVRHRPGAPPSAHPHLVEYYEQQRNDLNRDGVVSAEDLVFRADVPNGLYRVSVKIGDMSQALGSMDVFFNGALVGSQVSAWAPSAYRDFDRTPGGWWTTVRATVDAGDGVIRIALKKNQSRYDEQLAEQQTWETPYKQWYHAVPVVQEPPYHYIGLPFAHHSVMAIEILPAAPGPVTARRERLTLEEAVESPALREAIEAFNTGDYDASLAALRGVTDPEPRVQAARAIVGLWLAGRPEIEAERALVPDAVETLRAYVSAHPDEHGVAEILDDAEIFQQAHTIHLTRGALGKNHFIENDKAIAWWWLLQEDSPLYWKAQLHIARAGHMLKPYFPVLGTEGEIFRRLEQRWPDNRFVKYHLHQEWEQHGDGSDYYDWVKTDYLAKAGDAPEWARQLYAAYAGLVDVSEWWIKFRQGPEGAIGGGWGDDVELVGLFGYYGFISRGVSDLCVGGTAKLVEGLWSLSEVDPETGFCLPMADAEHSAEWTGNTLGMMVQIDYGNPMWIERSMKTGKLMRDLWTSYDVNGHRRFRANVFGAAQVGRGDQANDSFINYRAIRPAAAVLWYNQNPTISRLMIELAEAWTASALSTERGKPKGVIPAQVSFPDALLGGVNSPNWWTAAHPPGTVNYDWASPTGGQAYKYYIHDLLVTAYGQTGDEKFLEPLRLEYELARRHGRPGRGGEGRGDGRGAEAGAEPEPLEPGSEPWVAANLRGADAWIEAERMLRGREGSLENTRTLAQVEEQCRSVNEQLHERWPIMTSEAGPTDRVGFFGIPNPYFIYTGGRVGGPLLRAAVTYDNTTKDFAAAVLGADAQGLRIVYYSMAPDTRVIHLVPWELESAAEYVLRYGLASDDEGTMGAVIEEREFHFAEAGDLIPVEVEPRKTYVIEIDQKTRGRRPALAPDPGLSGEDIRYSEAFGLILARIHNVGSEPVRDVEVACYDGDPKAGGALIGRTTIPNIEAPIDLEPRATTVGFSWRPTRPSHEITIVVDPEGKIADDITTFNNVARATLPEAEKASPTAPRAAGRAAPAGRRGR